MAEAAAEVGASRRWLQDNLEGIPYLRVGRKKLFDEAALYALREKMRCPIDSSLRRLDVGRTGAFAGRKTGSTLIEALRLATAKQRRGF